MQGIAGLPPTPIHSMIWCSKPACLQVSSPVSRMSPAAPACWNADSASLTHVGRRLTCSMWSARQSAAEATAGTQQGASADSHMSLLMDEACTGGDLGNLLMEPLQEPSGLEDVWLFKNQQQGKVKRLCSWLTRASLRQTMPWTPGCKVRSSSAWILRASAP